LKRLADPIVVIEEDGQMGYYVIMGEDKGKKSPSGKGGDLALISRVLNDVKAQTPQFVKKQ